MICLKHRNSLIINFLYRDFAVNFPLFLFVSPTMLWCKLKIIIMTIFELIFIIINIIILIDIVVLIFIYIRILGKMRSTYKSILRLVMQTSSLLMWDSLMVLFMSINKAWTKKVAVSLKRMLSRKRNLNFVNFSSWTIKFASKITLSLTHAFDI